MSGVANTWCNIMNSVCLEKKMISWENELVLRFFDADVSNYHFQ
jgi:hypothetical protein